jgi:hypothetical protein
MNTATPSTATTAYVIPAPFWDKVYKFYQEFKNKQKGDGQEGGAVGAVNPDGSVRSNDLMHALAVNLSLQQSPKLEFVKKADLMLKQVLSDPSLTPDELVRYLESYTKAYQDQRMGSKQKSEAATVNAIAAATPATMPPPSASGFQPSLRRTLPQTPTKRTSSVTTPKATTSFKKKTPKMLPYSPLTPPLSELTTKIKRIDNTIEKIRKETGITPAQKTKNEERIGTLTRAQAKIETQIRNRNKKH